MQSGSFSSTLAIGVLTSIVGIVGVIVGHWLSARSQHKQFIRNSRTDEYRNLLDVLGGCVREINELKNHIFAPSTFAREAREVMSEGARLQAEKAQVTQQIYSTLLAAGHAFDGKLFIGDALTKYDVKGDWRKIEEMAHLPSAAQHTAGQEAFSTAAFTSAWIELAKKIRSIAAEDV